MTSHAPLLVAIVDGAQGGDGVHHQERIVAGGVHGRSHLGDSAGDPGGGLVVDHHDRLDMPSGVRVQAALHRRRLHAAAPVSLHPVHLQAEAGGHGPPEGGELAGLEGQHPVPGRQGVHERGLPGPGARRGVENHRIAGLDYRFQVFQDPKNHPTEFRAPVVHGGPGHGPQDGFRDVGGAGDLKEVPAGRSACGVAHGGCPYGVPHWISRTRETG